MRRGLFPTIRAKISRVDNETEECMEQLVNLSRFANDHVSEINRLESCITQKALALNEISSRADIIKGRILMLIMILYLITKKLSSLTTSTKMR